MLLTYYDVAKGIPVHVKTETGSMAEMKVLKDIHSDTGDWSRVKNAIYVVDRAFIDATYWKERNKLLNITVITRMKSTLNFTPTRSVSIAALVVNEKVLSDRVIYLDSADQSWRLIEWMSPEGIRYKYLTNDFSLEPGEVAFLYYRRWDEEKYFDNFKNDLANAKAWGKSPVAIEQQALMGQMTYLLTSLFLQRRYHDLDLPRGDNTQQRKRDKKIEQYLETSMNNNSTAQCQSNELNLDDEEQHIPHYDAFRAFYAQLSKITRQVWRFLKNCFNKKSSLALYQRQLKPLLLNYL